MDGGTLCYRCGGAGHLGAHDAVRALQGAHRSATPERVALVGELARRLGDRPPKVCPRCRGTGEDPFAKETHNG